MIEIYLLEQLDAFAKYGTLSKASEELHLTQPSLTRSMQKLEEIIGVPLFERTKNKLTLNENGLLAVDYAKRILDEEQHMIDNLRAVERSKRTLSVGSVGPGPLMEFVPSLSALFPDMPIISETKGEEELIAGLKNSQYKFIIISHTLDYKNLICEKYDSEQLYVSLPKGHRLAQKKKLSFSELNGESFLMLSDVGIWDKRVREELPDSRFILQNSYEALDQLIESSILPNFATDISIRAYENMNLPSRSIPDRVLVPITDENATITFYLISDKNIAEKYKVRN